MTALARLVRALDGQSAYGVLGVPASASAAEVKQAYREKARARHPDRPGRPNPSAMALVNVAYEVLRDLRTDYDRYLASSSVGRGAARRPHRGDDDRMADPGAGRPGTSDPGRGLWDDPHGATSDAGARAGPRQPQDERGAGPEPSLWDEPLLHPPTQDAWWQPPPQPRNPWWPPPQAQYPWWPTPPTVQSVPTGMPGYNPYRRHTQGQGWPTPGYPTHAGTSGYRWPGSATSPSVPSFFWLALISFLIMPLSGAVAILRSAEARARGATGDLAGARRAARSSLAWSLAGILIVILFFVVGGILA